MHKLCYALLALLFLAACKGGGHSDDYKNFKAIDEGLRERFDYPPGTYWIYKDSATGDLDSFYIKSADEFSMMGMNGYVGQKMLYGILAHGGSSRLDSINFNLIDNQLYLNFGHNVNLATAGFLLTYYPFVYPRYNTDSVGNMPDYLTLYPSYTVQGSRKRG